MALDPPNLDETKLTAFALGELDAVERAEVQAQLEVDEAARRFVEEVRAGAALLAEGLSREVRAGPGLDEARRSVVLSAGQAASRGNPTGHVAGRNNMLRLAARSVSDSHGPTPIYHVLTRPGPSEVRNPTFWIVAMAACLVVGAVTIGLILLAARNPLFPVAGGPQPGASQITMDDHSSGPAIDSGSAIMPPAIADGQLPPGPIEPGAVDSTAWNVKPDRDAALALVGAGPSAGPAMREGPHGSDDPVRIGLDTGMYGRWVRIVNGIPDVAAFAPRSIAAAALSAAPPATDKPDKSIEVYTGIGALPNAIRGGPLVSPYTAARPMTDEELRFSLQLREIQSNLSPLASRVFRVDPMLAPVPTTLPAGLEISDKNSFAARFDNPFIRAARRSESTFTVETDSATYAYVRRCLAAGQLPPKDAVRIEDFVNYFTYHYRNTAAGREPFAADFEMTACPWQPSHRLLRIALMARPQAAQRPAANLVFLVDGTMIDTAPGKLALVRTALTALSRKMNAADHLAIVLYGRGAGTPLSPTAMDDAGRAALVAALDRLNVPAENAGGIRSAYASAVEHLAKGSVNRVVLLTDAHRDLDGLSDEDLSQLIKDQLASGIGLDVAGINMDDSSDPQLEGVKTLAEIGQGRYSRIDTPAEAANVLADRLAAPMSREAETIARDVSVHVNFNPLHVSGYRLLGYERGPTDKGDTNSMEQEGPSVSAGHVLTALYELMPATTAPDAQDDNALLTLSVRYKDPDGTDLAHVQRFTATDTVRSLDDASADFKFAAAVAAFGMVLRDSPYKGAADFDAVLRLADSGRGPDETGYRAEFIDMVRRAQEIK